MRHQRGFTLIEVLLAVFLLALIGSLIAQVVSGFVRTQSVIREVSDRGRGLSTTMGLFESDIQNMIARVIVVDGKPTTAYYADAVNPLADFEMVRFSIQYRDSIDAQIMRTGMVAWGFDDEGRLFRDFWPHSNRVDDSHKRRRILLAEVAKARVVTWPHNIRNNRQTMEVFSSGTSLRQTLNMPQGAELVFTMEDGRTFRVVSATAPDFGEFVSDRIGA